ncbi:cytochrome c oxidase subunit 3 [Marinimicrobium sp. LS-A18]|uniref:cytochrome c oxidase subunit 3 n=1 Tax=Marinimicrobium sp. LS-A18 TaxID=1381596 RepID=UPI00046366BD|nr:cytochrome c oxidase subunit 3 [Marinimicrobium sp. LS-A18]
MKLWHALTEKSWLAESVPASVPFDSPQREFQSRRIALTLFLAIATVLFSLFAVTFLTHSQYPGFEALAGDAWRPLSNTTRLWVNTGLLVFSSVLMQVSLNAARASQPGLSLAALLGAGFLALQFLIAQMWLWQILSDMGYGVRSNPASSYFFLFTGVHGIHLLVGLGVLYRPLRHMWRAEAARTIIDSLRLCALYWHYLLAVWVLLFWLLTRSAGTYRALAILCGLEA